MVVSRRETINAASSRLLAARRCLNNELQQFAYNLQLTRPVGRPVIFQVELTNNCPMTCSMCPRTHSMERAIGNMSRDVFGKIVAEVAGTTAGFYLHHFGDSLMHPDLGWFIGETSRRKIDGYLSANPVLLTAQRIRAIVDNGLHELVLSIDGVTPETSEAVRGKAARNVKLAERRVKELLEYRASVNSAYPRVVLQIVRQNQNAHEVSEWLRRWSSVPGLDRVKVKSYITWNGAEQTIHDLRLAADPHQRAVVCEKPWTSVTVLWDGTVVPCNFDHDGLHPLGNLNHQTLKEIWQGEAMISLRRHHRDGDLAGIALCRACVDKEGYPVKKWSYPLNRLQQSVAPLSYEASPGLPAPGTEDASGHGRAKASRAFRTPYRDKIHSHPVPRSSRKARSKALDCELPPELRSS